VTTPAGCGRIDKAGVMRAKKRNEAGCCRSDVSREKPEGDLRTLWPKQA
jgi:hypothetical protein